MMENEALKVLSGDENRTALLKRAQILHHLKSLATMTNKANPKYKIIQQGDVCINNVMFKFDVSFYFWYLLSKYLLYYLILYCCLLLNTSKLAKDKWIDNLRR